MQQIGSEFLAMAATALKSRLDLDIPPGRCLLCMNRPAFVHDPDPYTSPARLLTAEDVAPCAVCGWQPCYIALLHVDELTGERSTTAEMIVKLDAERALVAELGWEALIDREKQRFAAWRATHPESQSNEKGDD